MGKGKRVKKAAPKSVKDVEEIFDEAEIAFMMEDYETAQAKYEQALKMDPQNALVMSGYGVFLAEVGREEEAVPLLQKAAQLDPDNGFEKYLYLGQVLAGPPAVEALQKGIELIRRELQAVTDMGGDKEELREIRENVASQLSSALCALAEEFMSSAAESAELGEDGEGSLSEAQRASLKAAIEPLVQEAHALDPASPEPMQVAAHTAVLCNDEELAAECIRASLACWRRPGKDDEASESESESSMSEGDNALPEGAELPSYEHRFSTAKLLLALDIEIPTAANVLNDLLIESDANLSVYLLLGDALCRLEEYENVEELLDNRDWAKESPADEEEAEVLSHILQMQQEVKRLLDAREGEDAPTETPAA